MDGVEILRRQRDAETDDLRLELPAERLDILGARLDAVELGDDFFEAGRAPLVRRRPKPARQQMREIVGAARRGLEQGFEQQMQQHVVAAHVDDEGQRRPRRRDIREVLIRPHTDIGAAGDAGLLQRANHMKIRPLVRDQIVGIEAAARL